MTRALCRALGAIASLLFVSALAGCGSSRVTAPAPDAARSAPATTAGAPLLSGGPDAGLLIAQMRGRVAHPYFPIVPGAFSDYKVTLIGEGTRYLRVTMGAPTLFFGRLATPLVYSAVPGMVPDTLLLGLRQYYSISPAGALWFHGAENGGVMSHSDPPVRQLLADPRPGDAWADTVVFESFLPGGVLFARQDLLYKWTLSEPARLPLPAGTFRAVRATSVIFDAPPTTALALATTRTEGGGADLFSGLGVALRPQPVDILKGSWFTRHVGIVARDWPAGAGPTNINIKTFELMDRGTGPVPPPLPPPLPPGTG